MSGNATWKQITFNDFVISTFLYFFIIVQERRLVDLVPFDSFFLETHAEMVVWYFVAQTCLK
jgi:hypothetical protein